LWLRKKIIHETVDTYSSDYISFLAMADQDFCKAIIRQELKFDIRCFKDFITENGLNIRIINHDVSIKIINKNH